MCGRNMVQENCAKYLGDWIASEGLAESVSVTVKKRKGTVAMSIGDIRTIVDDCRSIACGGLAIGIDLWELGVVPQLLFNSECWISMSQESLQELENLQLRFYRTLFAVGTGCPKPVLYWETGGIMMKYRILRKKLLFLHHIATLPENTLAREVYETQKRHNLPGLIQECENFMVKNNVINLCNFSANQWKKFVKLKIAEMNANEILCQMES